MEHILDILKERGFIAQMTFEDELYEQLKSPTTFYVGFDPTADSLHIAHYIPIMAMAHMQRAGHKPIALMGGGTAMIGDPSGKTDMRKMLTVETIDRNVDCIKKQMSRFLDFSDGQALIVNNGDWLRHLNFPTCLCRATISWNFSTGTAAGLKWAVTISGAICSAALIL